MKLRFIRSFYGFTIIELLVVIVVIGVLASVIIVSYSGLSSRSTVASLQSDLTNAKKQLMNFQVQSSTNSFPTAINCTNPSTTEICIRASGSNVLNNTTYKVNNSSNPPTFNLTATNGTSTYWINDSSNVMTTPNIVSSGILFNLDATNPASFNNISGNTTWADLSGNGNNAVLINSPLYSSGNGGYFTLNGSNQYANVSSLTDILSNSNYSKSVWFYLSSYSSNNNLISESSGNKHAVYLGGGNKILAGHNGNWGTTAQSTSSIALNTWYNVVVTFDSSVGWKIYINGQLDNSNASTATFAGSGNIQVGSFQTGNFLNGRIANAMVYNRTLLASEILQNYNATKDRYGL